MCKQLFGFTWNGLEIWFDLARLAQDLIGLIDLDRFVELTGLSWAGDLVGLENWLGCVVLAWRIVYVGDYVC